ncbi:MAG: hypothetical protein ACSLFD_05660 [Solirubrobacterales bacterium]
MRGISVLGSLAVAAVLLTATSSAQAEVGKVKTLADGVTQQITYEIPLDPITSGQNKIRYKPVSASGKPAVDGWITSIKPDLVYSDDGTIPSSSKVMFHHGVWVNLSRGRQQFYATGEEKTKMLLPDGYGYRYRKTDIWVLNEMIHNLTPEPMDLTATYRIDFIPDSAPEAASIMEAEPIWMDVEDGRNKNYPVFDVLRDSGGKDGEFTYPQDAPDAYPPGLQPNEWTAPRDGTLLGTTGHVHTGGLNTELFMKREGASYEGPVCKAPKKLNHRFKRSKKQIKHLQSNLTQARKDRDAAAVKKLDRKMKSRLKQHRKLKTKVRKASRKYKACVAKTPTVEGNRVRLFESTAKYFEPAGPVSWDMAMFSTKDDWRVQVKKDDILELQTTYETEIGSWYESMGINVVFWSDETDGRDPYKTKVDTRGVPNHGHYPENDDHGGELPVVGKDPTKRPDGLLSGGPFEIGGYSYEAGNFRLPGSAGDPPVVEKGDRFTFAMAQGDLDKEIWHSLTSCKAPCNRSTGIAYPLPDGDFQFDSGQLGDLNGTADPPTVGRTTWSTPANLPVGTHTYFCRIHPLMRGAFRVKPKT